MKVRFYLFVILISALFTCAKITRAQGQEPPDGYSKIFHDEFLNNLAGDWKLTRKIHGQTSQSEVHAEWVLNHQFLLIHMKETSDPSQYEAIVYIGYDNTSERYVAHWIDVGGGRFSETLGYGTRDGNSIKFNFEYPDGPFHNTFIWHPETKSWVSLMEHKDQRGQWVNFAEDRLGVVYWRSPRDENPIFKNLVRRFQPADEVCF